ncbi:hypothetical protein NH340_JMT06822 [Sarcoptes scabiei]|nr:hypothetical protein NH340_JMT06822 [Sarcoptes scabiei]
MKLFVCKTVYASLLVFDSNTWPDLFIPIDRLNRWHQVLSAFSAKNSLNSSPLVLSFETLRKKFMIGYYTTKIWPFEVSIFITICVLVDCYIHYGRFRTEISFWLNFIVVNSILILHMYRNEAFSASWFQLFLQAQASFKWEYDRFKNQFKIASKISLYKEIMILQRLNQTLNRTMLFAKKISPFICCFYYIFLIYNDMILVLLFDKSIDSFVFIMLLMFFLVSFQSVIATLIIFTQFNTHSRLLLPEIDRLLYAKCSRSNQKMQSFRKFVHSYTLPLKISEISSRIRENRIGLSCGEMFIFTKAKILNTFGLFAINFFLVFNFFHNY